MRRHGRVADDNKLGVVSHHRGIQVRPWSLPRHPSRVNFLPPHGPTHPRGKAHALVGVNHSRITQTPPTGPLGRSLGREEALEEGTGHPSRLLRDVFTSTSASFTLWPEPPFDWGTPFIRRHTRRVRSDERAEGRKERETPNETSTLSAHQPPPSSSRRSSRRSARAPSGLYFWSSTRMSVRGTSSRWS